MLTKNDCSLILRSVSHLREMRRFRMAQNFSAEST